MISYICLWVTSFSMIISRSIMLLQMGLFHSFCVCVAESILSNLTCNIISIHYLLRRFPLMLQSWDRPRSQLLEPLALFSRKGRTCALWGDSVHICFFILPFLPPWEPEAGAALLSVLVCSAQLSAVSFTCSPSAHLLSAHVPQATTSHFLFVPCLLSLGNLPFWNMYCRHKLPS